MKTFFDDGHLPELAMCNLKLRQTVIKRVIGICKKYKQCGPTTLNTIYQLEFIYQQESVKNNHITQIADKSIIGCLLLSSKYYESTDQTRFTPKRIERIFMKRYTIKQICEMEIDIIKKLDYNVDKLLMNQYNYYQCLNEILITKSIKKYFKTDINHKTYVKLCNICQDIAVELMYHLGTESIDDYHEISCAASIILIGFDKMQLIHKYGNELIHYLGMFRVSLLFILQILTFFFFESNSETNRIQRRG